MWEVEVRWGRFYANLPRCTIMDAVTTADRFERRGFTTTIRCTLPKVA